MKPLDIVARMAHEKGRMREARTKSHDNPYNNSRWRKLRASVLRAHPVCVACAAVKRITPSTTVDHIIPHKGNWMLMWDPANLQALCQSCHSSAKQRQEHRGNEAVDLNEWGIHP
jgi:5-methylcytosine-specific restriction enzyme A